MPFISSQIVIDDISGLSNYSVGASALLTLSGHRVASSDAILLVAVGTNLSAPSFVTFGGMPMTQLVSIAQSTTVLTTVFWLRNPPVGSYDIVIKNGNVGSAVFMGVIATTLLGVNKKMENPIIVTGNQTGSTSPLNITVGQGVRPRSLILGYFTAAYNNGPVDFLPTRDDQVLVSSSSTLSAGGDTAAITLAYVEGSGQGRLFGFSNSNLQVTGQTMAAIALEPANAASIWYPNIDSRMLGDTNLQQANNHGSPLSFTSGYISSVFFRNSFVHTIGRMVGHGLAGVVYTQTLTESVTHTDALTTLRTAIKTVTETVTHTDTLFKIPARLLTETITHTDTLLKQAGRTLSETVSQTDTVLKTAGRTLSETVTHTDTLIKQAVRTLSETVTHTDTITHLRTAFATLTETVTHTDTLLRVIGKVLSDTQSLTDTVIRSVVHTLTETITHTDTVIKIAGRALTETVTQSDVFISLRTAFATLTDTLTHTDTLIRIPGKVLSESTSLTDSVVRTIQRLLSDTVTSTDSVLKQAGRFLSETITHTDTLFGIAGKLFAETITTTDSILRLTSRTFVEAIAHLDILSIVIGRVLTDATGLADSLIRLPGKALLETITHSDTFSYLNQLGEVIFTETVSISDSLLRTIQKVMAESLTFTDSFLQKLLGKWFHKKNTAFEIDAKTNWDSKNNTQAIANKNTNWYNKNGSDWQESNDED